jgi:Tol biopolymer transport system component
MRKRQYKAASAGAGLVSLMTVGAMLFNAMPAAAVDFAHPAFKRVWDRTDSLVASGQVSRTFFWGPEPLAAVREQYLDAPDGTQTRLVQYFDKSRMEINNPNADPNAIFFVTNGLLTIELISGQMQIGNNAFVNRFSANIPISGDTDDANAPTYASFLAVSNTRRSDHPQADRTGQNATNTINKAGQVGNDPSKASDAGTRIAYYEPTTRHNIPSVFWQFLNATGPISETGQIVNKRLIDPWFYASGLPISDAYWTKVKINGTPNVDVMIQAYERRVLTYVPTNPPGFRVEMGNIGLHYRDWRYTDAGRPTGTITAPPSTGTVVSTATVTATAGGPTMTPTAAGTPPTNTPTVTGTPPTNTPTVTSTPNIITQGVIAFGSEQTGNKEIFRIKVDGTEALNLTRNPATDDFPAFSPDFTKVAFTTNRDGNDEIYVMNSDGSGVTRLTNNPGRDYAPAWSPDGSRIVFFDCISFIYFCALLPRGGPPNSRRGCGNLRWYLGGRWLQGSATSRI